MKKRLTENDLCTKDVLFNLSDSQHQFYLPLLSTLRAVDTKQESWGGGLFCYILLFLTNEKFVIQPVIFLFGNIQNQMHAGSSSI